MARFDRLRKRGRGTGFPPASDTVISDENAREPRKCRDCGKELGPLSPHNYCPECLAGPPTPAPVPVPVPEKPKEEYAKITHDEQGRPVLERIVIEGKRNRLPHVGRACKAVCVILLVSTSVSIALTLVDTGGLGNPDWESLEDYYTVRTWMSVTDNPIQHVLTAMRFYVYDNDTWNEVVFHNYENMHREHNFGKVPLGLWSCVRASIEWGLWSHPPTMSIAIMLDNAGQTSIDYYWNEYTIHVEATGVKA